MREFTFLAFAYISIVALYSAQSSDVKLQNYPEFENMEDMKAIAESQNKFTRDLYVALSKGSSGNLFFSPFSIATALSMVYIGSKENTQSQMKSVLHLPDEKSSIRKAFRELISDLKKVVAEYELRTSNMAYISDKLSVTEDFASALTNDFLSSSKLVDFSQSEIVRKEINDVVEKETNSKIKDLIPTGVLDEMTRMVLVNAIYFKGLWLHQFAASDTKAMPFWVTKDKSVDVQMMTVEKDFRMAPKPELNATLLALDYQGGRLSMVILLPNERDGLAALEEKISSLDLENLDHKTATSKTRVFIPKFKLEETLELVPILSEMGMSDLFSGQSADLSGISGNKDLFVSNVIHKAFLEVNEEGSEAAAATGAFVRLKRSLDEPETFLVDRPFTFVIYDKASLLSVFVGRLSLPPIRRPPEKDEL